MDNYPKRLGRGVRLIGAASFATIAGVALTAAPASAAVNATAAVISAGNVRFTAGDGQDNTVRITLSGRIVTFDDRVSITAGRGCAAVSGDATRVTCDFGATPAALGIVVYAGDGNDTVTNDSGVGMIGYGNQGKDLLIGSTTAADRLLGEWADDELQGRGGNDTADGYVGDDKVYGNDGTDTVTGGDGNDTVSGGNGNDVVSGGAGTDTVHGDAGDDTVNGEAGNDLLRGGDNADKLEGGVGDDLLDGGFGPDSVLGGEGIDTLSYATRTAPVYIPYGFRDNETSLGEVGEWDWPLDGEIIEGGSGDDRISVFEYRSSLLEIHGNGGNDRLAGSKFADGGAGDDSIVASEGGGHAIGGEGNDTLRGQWENDLLEGGPGNDTINGDEGRDTLKGDDGNDTLAGGYHEDQMYGGAGDDSLVVDNSKNDNLETLDGGPGRDAAHFEQRGHPLTIDLDNAVGDDGEAGEAISVIDIEVLYGGSDADVLTGNDEANEIFGGPGKDTIAGLGGDDRLIGGENADGADDLDGGDNGTDAGDACLLGPSGGTTVNCETDS